VFLRILDSKGDVLDLNLISCGVASHVQLFDHLGGGSAFQSNKPSGIPKTDLLESMESV